MPGQRVEISYEAYVKSIERIEDLIRKNEQLQGQVTQYQSKLKEVEKQEEKNESVNLKLRKGILAFRKELFAIGLAITATTAFIKLLSLGSDALAERLEKLALQARKLSAPLGNFVAGLFGNKGQLSTESAVRLLALQSESAALRGDTYTALLKRIEAEEKKLIKDTGALWETTYKSVFEERKKLLIENFRLEELGLKRIAEISRDLKRDLVGAFKGGTTDTLTKLFSGQQQTGAEIMQTFREGLARALATAISESLFTSVFQGGNFFNNLKNIFTGRTQAVIAQEKTTEAIKTLQTVAQSIARCVCETAANTAAIASAGRGGGVTSITMEGSKASGLSRAAAIVGAVGSLASLGAGFAAGIPSVSGGGLPPGANISMGPGAFATGRYGGWWNRLPRYQTGGEVPAVLHAGEFVVNARAAATNKEMLKSINSGGPGTGGNNFYVTIKANDSRSFDEQLSTPSARQRLEIQIIRVLSENGTLRRVMKDTLR